jgi:hypothetical protein
METCRYIYIDGDKAVIDGRAKVGDRCTCPAQVSEKSHWLCGGHLKQWNKLNNPDVNAETLAKQKATLQATRKRALDKNKEIVENSTEILGEATVGVLKQMNRNKEVDLAKEYLILKNLKQDPTQENYAEKYAFALWLNAPDTLRTPKTIEEAAQILGVSVFTVTVWRRSPEIIRIVNNDTKLTALRDYNYVWEKIMEGVARGDKGFADIALKHIKEIDAANSTVGKAFNLPSELKEEAARICNDGTANRATGVTDKIKKVAVYDGLTNGDIKPSGEIAQ